MDPFALNIIMILCFIVGSGLIILEAFIPGSALQGSSGSFWRSLLSGPPGGCTVSPPH